MIHSWWCYKPCQARLIYIEERGLWWPSCFWESIKTIGLSPNLTHIYRSLRVSFFFSFCKLKRKAHKLKRVRRLMRWWSQYPEIGFLTFRTVYHIYKSFPRPWCFRNWRILNKDICFSFTQINHMQAISEGHCVFNKIIYNIFSLSLSFCIYGEYISKVPEYFIFLYK